MQQESIQIRIALNLRRLRSEKAVSLSELARDSGMSKGTVAKLETGSGNPTVETLQSLANSLGVSVNDLLTDEDSRVRVVRAAEGAWVEGSALGYRLVDRLLGRNAVDVHEFTFANGMRRESKAHVPGTLEHLFVTAGRLSVGPIGDTVELRVGDYVRFLADRPHTYEAVDGDARAILLISYLQAPSSKQEMQRELDHLLSVGDERKRRQLE